MVMYLIPLYLNSNEFNMQDRLLQLFSGLHQVKVKSLSKVCIPVTMLVMLHVDSMHMDNILLYN